MDTFGRFSAIIYKGDNFLDFLLCFPVHAVLSEKGSTLKGKTLLTRGANSFFL